ncbi:MAG: hypothetical protein H6737_18725 [Alphaproteobacteria bacterium]|nr:hypothetical protein [Alphaproteobacteria bacterium]
MRTTALVVLLGLVGCKGPVAPDPPDEARHFELDERLAGKVGAMVRGQNDRLWVALGDDFAVRDSPQSPFEFAPRGDLPPGEITFLGHIDGSREWLFAHVFGKGFYRSWANSGVWEPVLGLRSSALDIVRQGARPIPRAMAQGEDVTWLAAIGGLYFTNDEGATWELADTASSGNTNLVFTDVAARGDFVAGVSVLPESLIPSSFSGLLSGRVFFSRSSGLTFDDADGDFPSRHPTSVTLADDGTLYVGTMDHGVVRLDGATWTPLYGPTDVVDLEWSGTGLSVASASRGLWRLEGDDWSQVAPEAPAVGVEGNVGIIRGGDVYTLVPGRGDEAPPPANGTVHVALSFHMNYYHSYRGDTNDEDGFGRDIRIIRSILDWLDEHPQVRADWDSDNAFTTDDWAASYSPDVLTRIRDRVESGRDQVRLMSWNNGAMASHTNEEFVESIQRAKDSNTNVFGGYVDGVQPQENMISPDDIQRYADRGIDWVTLFYGANGFTGPRNDIRLDGAAAYNPFELGDPVTDASILGIPVYHHADLLDHGGLRGWVSQLNARYDQDTLLVIHFDADGDSWEHFDKELDAIADLPFVEYTTIADYVATHGQLADVDLPGDVADGVADGFSSWAEKAFNQEIWTRIEQSRRYERAARFVGAGDVDTNVALEAALEPRLLALSTTNFGLAAPSLHPDREASATLYADEAVAAALTAWDLAEQSDPLPLWDLTVVNPFDASGPTPIPFQLRLPNGVWEGENGLIIDRSGTPQPIRAWFSHYDPLANEDVINVVMLMDTPALSETRLTWSYDPGDPTHAVGNLTAADVPELPNLLPPMTECRGSSGQASGGPIGSELDPWGLRATRNELWLMPTCSGATTVRRSLSKIAEFPGLVLEVEATLAAPEDAEDLLSVALSPLVCPGGIDAISWQSYAGTVRTRDVPDGLEAWNPVTTDGWFAVQCDDGSRVQVAVDLSRRASMGMLSLRNEGPDGLIAPLGTLWGDPPWHDGQRTGGSGLADLVTPLIGSQFTPSAPDWAGQHVEYRMWITADVPPELLVLFAHPPVVRVPPLP